MHRQSDKLCIEHFELFLLLYGQLWKNYLFLQEGICFYEYQENMNDSTTTRNEKYRELSESTKRMLELGGKLTDVSVDGIYNFYKCNRINDDHDSLMLFEGSTVHRLEENGLSIKKSVGALAEQLRKHKIIQSTENDIIPEFKAKHATYFIYTYYKNDKMRTRKLHGLPFNSNYSLDVRLLIEFEREFGLDKIQTSQSEIKIPTNSINDEKVFDKVALHREKYASGKVTPTSGSNEVSLDSGKGQYKKVSCYATLIVLCDIYIMEEPWFEYYKKQPWFEYFLPDGSVPEDILNFIRDGADQETTLDLDTGKY
jgi:hypothetical protein